MEVEPIEILLAEDNEDDIVIIQEALGQSRVINLIQITRDGEETLAYLRRQGPYRNARQPGLILLDINMPKKNGLETLQEIKADPALRHLPVVMLTVSEREEDIAGSYARGACSFVRKPVDFERLLVVVRNFELYWTLVAKIPSPHQA